MQVFQHTDRIFFYLQILLLFNDIFRPNMSSGGILSQHMKLYYSVRVQSLHGKPKRKFKRMGYMIRRMSINLQHLNSLQTIFMWNFIQKLNLIQSFEFIELAGSFSMQTLHFEFEQTYLIWYGPQINVLKIIRTDSYALKYTLKWNRMSNIYYVNKINSIIQRKSVFFLAHTLARIWWWFDRLLPQHWTKLDEHRESESRPTFDMIDILSSAIDFCYVG